MIPQQHLTEFGDTQACLVWFGLVGFSFNASLSPQRRARLRGRFAVADLAHHALWDKAEYPEKSRPDPWAACAAERRLITYSTPSLSNAHRRSNVVLVLAEVKTKHTKFSEKA